MLTAPPGRSEVASASASSTAASGWLSEATATTVLPPTSGGRIRETSPPSAGSGGREHRDHAGGLRHREVEVRPGDRIGAADDLRELVREARVPDDTVDRGFDLLATGAHVLEVGGAGLHHLGQAVEDLAAVVGGQRRPGGEGGASGTDGVSCILARGAGDVLAFGLVRAPGLRAREVAADVELVGLLDREARHAAALAVGGVRRVGRSAASALPAAAETASARLRSLGTNRNESAQERCAHATTFRVGSAAGGGW